jgi:hypothetical protein
MTQMQYVSSQYAAWPSCSVHGSLPWIPQSIWSSQGSSLPRGYVCFPAVQRRQDQLVLVLKQPSVLVDTRASMELNL